MDEGRMAEERGFAFNTRKLRWQSGSAARKPRRRHRTRCRFTALMDSRDKYNVERFFRNAKGAPIYEGSREIHKLMQADYYLGYRTDHPVRCMPPTWEG